MTKEVRYPGLKEDEQQALREMLESGASMDLFLRELKGNMPGIGWGKYFKKFVDKAGIFMQTAEKFNRASTGLAAYRVGIKEKNMSHDEAIDFAKQIIYDSHFLYGKHNLPSAMRGGAVRKIMRSGYTFRSFTHNYLNMMAHMLKNQGVEGKLAAARSLRNIFIMGGLTSIPFFDVFADMLMWVIGRDDEDALTKVRSGLPRDWMKDMVTYGLPGVAGIDLTGSLSIEVPRNWQDIIGVPYSIMDDSVKSYESWKSGQTFRAVSELPVTPMAVKNAMRGMELYLYGQTTRSGKAVTKPTQVKPRKISAARAVQKGVFGLQPTELSKGYAAYRASGKPLKKLEKKKKYFADRYTNALRKGDGSHKIVEKELREYNKKMREMGKPYMVVDPGAMIKSRFKPGIESIPKKLRGKTIETYQQW
jgi:hypothetical protein